MGFFTRGEIARTKAADWLFGSASGGAESPVYPVQEDRMPYVTIVLREGRSVEQKREMVKAVTEAISRTTGARPEMVHIIVHDLPGHNLARDGILLSDRA